MEWPVLLTEASCGQQTKINCTKTAHSHASHNPHTHTPRLHADTHTHTVVRLRDLASGQLKASARDGRTTDNNVKNTGPFPVFVDKRAARYLCCAPRRKLQPISEWILSRRALQSSGQADTDSCRRRRWRASSTQTQSRGIVRNLVSTGTGKKVNA